MEHEDRSAADAHLRRVAGQLGRGPAGDVEAAASEMLGSLDRLQRELDVLLAGLRTTAERLADAADPGGAGR